MKLQITTDLETYLYNYVEGIITHIVFTLDDILVTTDVDNYRISYNKLSHFSHNK